MYGAMMKFENLPEIGFAHHFYMENYKQKFEQESQKSLELVYVKKGSIKLMLYDEEFIVKPESVLVLFRHLPISLVAADDCPQMHCSVQLIVDYEYMPVCDNKIPTNFVGLVLPMILEPSPETEKIGKALNKIVSQIGMDRNANAFSSSLTAMGVLSELDKICRKSLYSDRKLSSILVYKIKKYLQENIDRNVSLEELSTVLKKTPNHLNSVFRKCEGISICKYASKEKAQRISELMQNKSVPFKTACENVGIFDLSYGYRFFKKQIGMTPTEYLHGRRYVMEEEIDL